MRNSSQCEREAAQRAMSPAHNSILMFAILFISFIPITTSAPVLLNPSSIEHEQLLTQITDLCSFYLSADPSFRTSDVLEDLCFLMLGSLQKSKDITARETSKRDDLQGPGRIQSRGYFLYRPRNGRRAAEYV
ncbi:neuromedin-U isoform X4 [Pimephales promelas]|uniref:neuromedin-U isoform X4 n=1 Tax=Pimephales promelas TaxID=90988 RepID=UPI0019557A8D|nr:neuromedin-U isoform X4 [Pimephales promelas]KAG1964281.1 neuromedin-U [Pimephales promelas]KAG1964282.1 neuromedin-U [Pimephales promelas]